MEEHGKKVDGQRCKPILAKQSLRKNRDCSSRSWKAKITPIATPSMAGIPRAGSTASPTTRPMTLIKANGNTTKIANPRYPLNILRNM